jgi:F0F1-type ATP synthase membrane subunit b/b'
VNPDLTVFWVIFFVLLTGLILDRLILRPLLRVMGEREGAVTAARALAETASARARAATAEFDTKTQAARSEIYREMDEKRRLALERRNELLARTRGEAEAAIGEATARVRAQAAEARARLEQEANTLAAAIVERVLGRKAS